MTTTKKTSMTMMVGTAQAPSSTRHNQHGGEMAGRHAVAPPIKHATRRISPKHKKEKRM
jgi:hypothetical protein